MTRARTWDEFRAAVAAWPAPSLNFVYADRQGNIGYVQAGTVPRRAAGDGLAPMAGWTGGHEWQGMLPADELPRASTPEAGWLAKYHPNVYLDSCWMPILNPEFLRDALESWLNYVPSNKIMVGNDATSVEMAVGASLFTREIVTEALAGQSHRLGLKPDALHRVAQAFLNDNAVAVYGIGEHTDQTI